MTQTDPAPDDASTDASSNDKPRVMVKKYANRRLYDTESSSYITLENLAEMVRQGRDFVVQDAKTGTDITRSVLTQIIVEEENKGTQSMLPIPFLRQLIGFYGDSLQGVVPRYLEQSMAAFGRQQQQMRAAVQQTVGSFLPPGFEEVGRQNMAMIERAMSLFTPAFYKPEPARSAPEAINQVAALQAEIATLRAELDAARDAKPSKGGKR